jgi:hypothetical protein
MISKTIHIASGVSKAVTAPFHYREEAGTARSRWPKLAVTAQKIPDAVGTF